MNNQTNDQTIDQEIIEAELVSAAARQPLVERLLSKQSLDRMMFCGGSMLVVGFAVWLWSIGLFENPLILAGSVGLANLTILGLGLWMYLGTSYKFTGRGIAFLGSLLLPLNLWLYESQQLISIADGGQLWIPALIISILYAGITRLTRDPIFVFTFVGGVALTGLLFLAGTPILWSMLPIATLLVALGIVCIHADAWFLEGEGDFARAKFGLAFFKSGFISLTAGLASLAGGQFPTFINDIGLLLLNTNANLVRTDAEYWNLGVLLAALYALGYSYFSKRSGRWLVLPSVAVCVWAALTACDLFNIVITWNTGLLLLPALLTTANIACRFFKIETSNEDLLSTITSIAATLILASAAGDYFMALFVNGALVEDWIHHGRLLFSSAAILTLPGQWSRESRPKKRTIIGASGLALSLIAALFALNFASLITTLLVASIFQILAAITILLPEFRNRGVSSAIVASSIVFGAVWFSVIAVNLSPIGLFTLPSILLVGILAANCCFVGAMDRNRSATCFGCLFSSVCAIQLFVFFELLNAYAVTTTITSAGILLILASKIAKQWEKMPKQLTTNAKTIGKILVEIGAVGAILFVGNSLLNHNAATAQLGLLVVQLLGIGFAALSTRQPEWRRGYLLTAVATVICGVAVLVNLSTLTLFQQVEIASLTVGITLTIAGYIGWSRENGERSKIVTGNLLLGSLLITVPLMIALVNERFIVERSVDAWRYFHEIGALVAALLLLGSGIAAQVRSTTLSGAILMSVFVFSNILLIEFPDQLQQTSVLMMIGGGAFFGTAVLLSIYRERLMKIPEKVKQGKGIFKILKWR